MEAGDEFVEDGGTYLQLNVGATKANAQKTVVVNENDGVTVTPMSNYFKINVDSDCVAGDKTITISGQTLTLTVKNYRFASDAVTLVKPYDTGVGTSMNLWDEQANALASVVASDLTVSDPKLAVSDINPGQYSFGSTDGGVYTVSYKNTKAKCVVTVEEYSIATPAAIAKSTGAATIEVKCNGETINAATASLVETAKPDGAVYTVTTNGKLIKFSNASKAGDYKFDYKVGTTVVAQVTVTVTE